MYIAQGITKLIELFYAQYKVSITNFKNICTRICFRAVFKKYNQFIFPDFKKKF